MKRVVINVLFAFVPVALALMLWIWLRSDALVKKSVGMEPGFLVPETRADAIVTGYTIWLPIYLVISFMLGIIYYLWSGRLKWNAWWLSAIVVAIAAVVSADAFAAGMAFAVEAIGEMLTIGLGYGVLMPLLISRTFATTGPAILRS